MKIPRVNVDDEMIDIAFSAPEEVGLPGHNLDAIAWVVEQRVQHQELGSFATLWSLTEKQKTYFANELIAPTPTAYPPASEHAVGRFGALQLLISSSLGLPYGLPHQRNGVLLQDVFPKEGLFDRANSGLGATEPFDFHTDQAFSADPSERPDFVTLGCVRNNERAITGIVGLSSVIEHLDEETIEQLSYDSFNVYTGRSNEGKGLDTGPILLTHDGGITTIRLGGDVEGINKDAQEALSRLKLALTSMKEKESIILEPGEILGFNNTSSIHFRSSFIPQSDPGERRWIRKTYIHAQPI